MTQSINKPNIGHILFIVILILVCVSMGFFIGSKTNACYVQAESKESFKQYMELRHRTSKGDCELIGASTTHKTYGFSCKEKVIKWVDFPKTKEIADKPIKKKETE